MASLLGPQWLCECGARGGAETDSQAGQGAAGHFLGHDGTGEGPYVVSVFKERNDWLYSISTVEKAMELAYPLREVKAEPGSTTVLSSYPLPLGSTIELTDNTGTHRYSVTSTKQSLTEMLYSNSVQKVEAPPATSLQWKPGQPIELGSLTMAEASERFQATLAALRGTSYQAAEDRKRRLNGLVTGI